MFFGNRRFHLLGLGFSLLILVSTISFLTETKNPDIQKRNVKYLEKGSERAEAENSEKNASVSPILGFSSSQDMELANVIKVVDGDTITVSLNGQNQTIRIIGINTPETVDPRRGVECFGIEASNKARKYFSSKNNQVFLEKDNSQSERDKYQRLLCYVFADNGKNDYGLMMISQGYAYEYTYDSSYKYQNSCRQAQKEAQENKRGLWVDEVCQGITQSQILNDESTNKSISNSIEGDKDCKDFATYKEAQDFFISQGGPASDLHRLDADKDGMACESLP